MRLGGALFIVIAAPAAAQVIDPATVPDNLTVSPRIEAVLEASTFSDPVAFVISRAQSAFGPANGVSLDGLDLRLKWALTGERARQVADFMIYDLNWDGEVTRAEFQSVRPDLSDVDIDRIVVTLGQDWPLTYEGLHGFVGDNLTASQAEFVRDMTDWDLNGDGLVAVEEMDAILRVHLARNAPPPPPCDPEANPLLPPSGDLPPCEDGR